MEISYSDLERILEVLRRNEAFHLSRDSMNAELHCAPKVLQSPLTIQTVEVKEMVAILINS